MTTEFETMRSHQSVATQTWSEELAQNLANERGVGTLTPEHWHIIRTLRQHYIQYSAVPPMRYVCDANRLDPHCVDKLFHSPQEAWQIAGIPAPNEEAQGYSYPGDMVQH